MRVDSDPFCQIGRVSAIDLPDAHGSRGLTEWSVVWSPESFQCYTGTQPYWGFGADLMTRGMQPHQCATPSARG